MGPESSIQNEIVKMLRKRGWFVNVNSKHRRAYKQEMNKPDLECYNRNVAWLIEVKQPGEDLRPGQKKFKEGIAPFLGKNLCYSMLSSLESAELQATAIEHTAKKK